MPVGLFKKKEKAPTTNQSIQRLQGTIDMIEKREAVLNRNIEQELQKAKVASTKKSKQTALLHLKRKKAYEEQLQRLQGQRLNIEQMQMKLEETEMNKEAFNAQKQGAAAIKHTIGKLTPDKVDKEMEDVRDVMDGADEVSQAISQPLGADFGLDDPDLEDEFDALVQEEMDAQMLDIATPTMMPPKPATEQATTPAVPTPAAAEPEEDEEEAALAALEAELNA